MASGLLYRCQGVITTAATALMSPPRRKSTYFGATLARSYDADTKFATMLMPIVAMTNVIAPMIVTPTLSIRETISTGSVIASPNTAMLPAVTATVTTANAMKLIGRPQKLPRTTVGRFGANREKSQKFNSSVEK